MINRSQSFKYPDIKTKDIGTMTPSIPSLVDSVAQTYGGNIGTGLAAPQMEFGQWMKGRRGQGLRDRAYELYPQFTGYDDTQIPFFAQEAARTAGPLDPLDLNVPKQLGEAEGMYRNLPVTVDDAYKASLDEGDRRFKTYGLPEINEQFGKRGLRYSTAIADAGAREYSDIQSKYGSEAAKAKIDATKVGAGGLASIGGIIQAINESNAARKYAEFLRFQPDAYYGAAQNFIGTKPIYPNVVTGGAPIVQNNPSQLDGANEYLNAIKQLSGIFGNFASEFA